MVVVSTLEELERTHLITRTYNVRELLLPAMPSTFMNVDESQMSFEKSKERQAAYEASRIHVCLIRRSLMRGRRS